jgi:NADPH:quinone reductase-like Zn-dependent oxidoreductase
VGRPRHPDFTPRRAQEFLPRRRPDAAGIVWAIGAKVRRWKVGDEVIVHCNQDDGDDEDCNGGDPMLSPSQRIWAVLVNAPRAGLRNFEDVLDAAGGA